MALRNRLFKIRLSFKSIFFPQKPLEEYEISLTTAPIHRRLISQWHFSIPQTVLIDIVYPGTAAAVTPSTATASLEHFYGS